MKLILTSQGFTTNQIAQAVSKLVGKPLQNINIRSEERRVGKECGS